MAWTIRQQVVKGKYVKRKMDRRWMMDVLKAQQETINNLSTLYVSALQKHMQEEQARMSALCPPTPIERAVAEVMHSA